MSDDSTPAGKAGLIENLDSLERNLESLESVLKTMFDMYADKGVQPTFHVTQALDKMRDRFTKSEGAAIETLRQLDQLNELVRTSALITSSLELDNVLEEVLDTVNKLTGAERAYLMLYDEQSGLQMKAARNWDRQTISEGEAHFSNSIVDAAMQDGLPIITTNAQTDERFSHKESIAINQLRSIVCVPLVMRGKSIGVLYADNRYTQAVFSDAMVPLLIAFGTQAAIAISNARLFGEVRENLAEAHAEIDRLRIAVDQRKMDTQVDEIVDTEYFKKIKRMKTEANLKIDQSDLKKAKSKTDSED